MNIKNIARDKLTTNLDKIGRTVCAIHAACARRDNRGGVLVMLALLCGLLATTAPLQAAMTFDFEDGTLQGWTSVMDGGASEIFTVTNDTSGDRGGAQGGSYRVLPENFANRDTMTPTLLLRSAKFTLDGSGDISAYLRGGNVGTAPASSTDLPVTAINNGGFQGIALRRVSDNAYVFSAGKASNGGGWEQATIDQASLDTLSAGFGTEVYTLDFVDSARGGYGWVAMDTVSIPGTIVPDWNNYGVSNVTVTTADAYATLISTNVTSGYLYWDTTDKGENFTWAHTNILGALSTGLVESTISGLTPDTTYYARFYGTNSTAEVNGWSDVISFNTALSSAAYDYGMPITFTNFAGRGTLTNFPALVKFNTNDNFYTGFTSDDAHDLRFTESDSTTLLNYEIEKWNTNGESFVWVQIPELTHNGSIWAYWGRSGAVQPAYATNGAAWDSNFRGVWHLSDTNSVGKLPDSTGNPNDGTNFDTVNVENQVIGDAQLFTGDYIDCGTDPSLDLTTALTVSAWGYFENNDNAGFVYAGGGWNTAGYGLHAFGGGLLAEFRGGGTASTANNPKPTEDQWTHVTATWDNIGQTIRVYYNGVQQANTAARTAVNAIGTNFKIGKANSGNFDGMIDEVRAEAVSRSSNWVWACYQNQGANHDSFTEYGRVINIGGTVILVR